MPVAWGDSGEFTGYEAIDDIEPGEVLVSTPSAFSISLFTLKNTELGQLLQ